jgi:hypothetical protein
MRCLFGIKKYERRRSRWLGTLEGKGKGDTTK